MVININSISIYTPTLLLDLAFLSKAREQVSSDLRPNDTQIKSAQGEPTQSLSKDIGSSNTQFPVIMITQDESKPDSEITYDKSIEYTTKREVRLMDLCI